MIIFSKGFGMAFKFKWNFPILRKISSKYKELGFIKFAVWFFIIWFGTKVLILNVIGPIFFDMEPFPVLNLVYDGLKGSLNYLFN